MAMTGILAVQMVNSGMDIGMSITIAVLAGTAIGFINGFLVVILKCEAFIITMGMGMAIKGVALQLTNGNPIFTRDPGQVFMSISNGSLLGIPNIIVYMLILGVIAFALLRYTGFGRNCYALGGDYEVAEHSGINVIKTKWLAFVISGTYAGIAGVLMASRMNSGSPIIGDAIPLITNASVVLGGTSFAGGIGGPIHSFVGVMVVQFLHNSMSVLRLTTFQIRLVLGIVIVAIISMDCLSAKWRNEGVSPMDAIKAFFNKLYTSRIHGKKSL
jgi:ribose/xylose/arabinose/galactoside ABC-type transport system permease subunit